MAALASTFKRELIIGAVCQILQTGAQTVSPYLLKYLIAFSTSAFNARNEGTQAPAIGYGVGLVFAITGLQLLMTFAINHFIYTGQTVGGESRSVLMSVIFAKSLKISGRAKAGGGAVLPPTEIEPGSEDEKKWFKKMLPGGGKKSKNQEEDGTGWSNGRIVNLMSTDTYRIDQASGFFHLTWGSPLSIIVTMVGPLLFRVTEPFKASLRRP